MMKKTLFLLWTMMTMLTAQAEDYPYLTFQLTDGTRVSVPAQQLTVGISGNTLTAGTESFTLTNLSKMYFSMADESTTGVSEVTAADVDEATDIYNLQGHKVDRSQMGRGVYVVKTKIGTFKLTVR